SGVVQLRRLGVLDEVMDSGVPAIKSVTFNVGGDSLRRTVKHHAGGAFVVAPRRYVLDSILSGAAQRAGAAVSQRVTVSGVLRDGHGRGLRGERRQRAGHTT